MRKRIFSNIFISCIVSILAVTAVLFPLFIKEQRREVEDKLHDTAVILKAGLATNDLSLSCLAEVVNTFAESIRISDTEVAR